MTRKSGPDRVKEAVAGAKVVKLRPHGTAGAAMPARTEDFSSKRFHLRDNGLWRKGDGQAGDLWVCGWLEPGLETRNDNGRAWGMLLSWRNRDGGSDEQIFGRALFNGECAELRARLADAGLSLGQSQAARQAFVEYVNSCASEHRARSVSRIGWHSIEGRQVFVLDAQTVYGDVNERVVLHVVDPEPSAFEVACDIEAWRREIGELCIGNSRLSFAVSCAFAAPLLGLLGEEGGGFNLRGTSSAGKTTVLAVAASVCGGTSQLGARGFVRSWRATSNGLESVALASCDTLLLLDEMSQVDAKEAGEIAYTLGNGQTKARANRAGHARATARFRSLFLSSGEVGIADKNREAGRATRAGQEIRLADIPADAGSGLGAFEHLHDEASASDFVRRLRTATTRCYGAPLRAYLGAVCQARATGGLEYVENLRERALRLAASWLSRREEASGQVRRLAFRFALMAIAGELATELGLTGWPRDGASWAAESCFDAWLGDRGTLGSREDAQAVVALRAFISAHGNGRFEEIRDRRREDDVYHGEGDGQPPPLSARPVFNRAGWRIWEQQEDGVAAWTYLIPPDQLRSEILVDLDFRAAVRVLADRGFFRRDKAGRSSIPRKIPGIGPARFYEVPGRILGRDNLTMNDGE